METGGLDKLLAGTPTPAGCLVSQGDGVQGALLASNWEPATKCQGLVV